MDDDVDAASRMPPPESSGRGRPSLRDLPPGVALFLAYALLVLAAIAVTLPQVIEQAVVIPISPLGVVVMGLLAYTIFTITLTLQRKEASRPLAIGLSSLTLPAIPLLVLSRLPIEAAVVGVVAVALFVGLNRPATRAWLSEP